MIKDDPYSIVSVNLEPFGKDSMTQQGFKRATEIRAKEEKEFLTFENLVQEFPRKWKSVTHSFRIYKMGYFLFPRTQKLCRGEQVKINQGTRTLILKGEVLVQLTSWSLLVRNRPFQEKLGIFFIFQNN